MEHKRPIQSNTCPDCKFWHKFMFQVHVLQVQAQVLRFEYMYVPELQAVPTGNYKFCGFKYNLHKLQLQVQMQGHSITDIYEVEKTTNTKVV